MTTDDDLERRLRSAYDAEPDPDVRRGHLEHIHAAAEASRPRRWLWRHRVAVVATAATVASPLGLAFAAQDALPGDVLYPIKRVAERVVGIVDPDVQARHRLEELAALLERDAPSRDLEPAVEQAREAVEGRGDAAQRRRLVALALEASQRDEGSHPDATSPLEPAPTREPLREPLPEASPTPDPTPTRPPADDPTASERPTSRPTASPSPSRDASPRPSPSPTSTPSPTRDAGRTEQHRALDAGVVTIEVRRDGIRLVAVDPARGWDWRADRSSEPRRVTVTFSDGQRVVILEASWSPDGGVQVRTEERRHDTDAARSGDSSAPRG